MNQIFRINVGSETLAGRLPPVRVGKGYSCRFYVTGVGQDETAPKIWIGASESDTLFWTGEWNGELGVWDVAVNTDATAAVAVKHYALTMTGDEGEYIAGQGPFTVYSHIAAGGGAGGETGESVMELIVALTERVETLEGRVGKVPRFDDIDEWVALYAADTEGIRTLTFEVPV